MKEKIDAKTATAAAMTTPKITKAIHWVSGTGAVGSSQGVEGRDEVNDKQKKQQEPPQQPCTTAEHKVKAMKSDNEILKAPCDICHQSRTFPEMQVTAHFCSALATSWPMKQRTDSALLLNSRNRTMKQYKN